MGHWQWLVLPLAVAAIATGMRLDGHRAPLSPCGAAGCTQEVAKAVYYAFDELDCDGQLDVSQKVDSFCTDELQNVNRAPAVDAITAGKLGPTVHLTVFEASGLTQHVAVRFDGAGDVVGVGS
jgi:hypothetical protein